MQGSHSFDPRAKTEIDLESVVDAVLANTFNGNARHGNGLGGSNHVGIC